MTRSEADALVDSAAAFTSEASRGLTDGGVLRTRADRLVVVRLLLTDELLRSVLDLEATAEFDVVDNVSVTSDG
ncbi:MAG: hypothetical protein R3258_10250 [Acidimicrobiia bacterium]|nr:hypothetical protein [Acidimicrobiia bacterium]